MNQSFSKYISDGQYISQQTFEIDEVTGLGRNLEAELAIKKSREQQKLQVLSDIDQKLKKPSTDKDNKKGISISRVIQQKNLFYYRFIFIKFSKPESIF